MAVQTDSDMFHKYNGIVRCVYGIIEEFFCHLAC
jgi:hypothetical protein